MAKIQMCVNCDRETERCEEDSLYVWQFGPLCVACYREGVNEVEEACGSNAEIEALRAKLAEAERIIGRAELLTREEGSPAPLPPAEGLLRNIALLRERAEAAEARAKALEAAAGEYLARVDYCLTADDLTLDDEAERDKFERRLRALLAPAPIPGPMLPPHPGATVEEVERVAMCNAAVPAEPKPSEETHEQALRWYARESESSPAEPCATCGGSGRVYVHPDYTSVRDMTKPCPDCRKDGGA